MNRIEGRKRKNIELKKNKKKLTQVNLYRQWAQ